MKAKINTPLGLGFAALIGFAGLFTAMRWATTVWHYRAIGVDNTDEGYYLSSVLFPHQIPHAPTDYAFYLRPVWILFGQQLPAYRVAGFLLIVVVSAVIACEFHRWVPLKNVLARTLFIGLTTSCIAGALAYQYVLWIPTPNYNLLGLCLLALASSVVLSLLRKETLEVGVETPSRYLQWTSSSWAGLVLFIVLTTRVTAGILVGIVFSSLILLHSLRQWRQSFSQILLGGVVGAAIHTCLTLRPPWRSVKSWMQSLELSKLRKDHSNRVLWEYDFFGSHVRPWLLWALFLIIGLAVARRLISNSSIRRIIALILSLVIIFDMWSARPAGGIAAVQSGVGWWWLRLTFYALLLSFLIPHKIDKRNFGGPFVAFFALAGAAGSANGLYHQLIFTAGLLVLAVLAQVIILVRQEGWKIVVVAPLCFFLLVFFTVGLTGARDTIRTPYRTVGSLSESSQLIEYGTFGNLRVHPNSAAFVEWVSLIRASLPENTSCVVNLEGATPVISALLGIKPAGTIWNLGSYPGSTEASLRSLELDNCWKTQPFLLIDAPSGDTALPVPAMVASLCDAPFTSFELNTDHKASMRASLCNQPVD